MRTGIALGSNIGDRLIYLRKAKARLLELHDGDQPALISAVYETEAIGCPPGTASFFNAVLEIESNLEPIEWLERTQQIESDLGRPAERPKNSPRTLDVDLLYIGDRIVDTCRLTLPHPRMVERRFVLTPLCELRPEMILPGTIHLVSEILDNLVSGEPPPAIHCRTW